MNELLQSEIMQKLYSVQKIARITASADRKIKGCLNICGFVLHLSLFFKLNSFFRLILYSPRIHERRGIKLTVEIE